MHFSEPRQSVRQEQCPETRYRKALPTLSTDCPEFHCEQPKMAVVFR